MRIPVVYENFRRRPREQTMAAVEKVGVDLPACGCDVLPTPETTPGPFTQVVKDPSKFEATMARAKAIGYLDNDEAVASLIRPDLEIQDQEVFVVVGLDLRNELRAYTEVARGVRDCAMVGIPDVLRAANIEGCHGFIVAHNHPSGDARPSRDDLTTTKKIAAGAEAIGLVFIDHLVIGAKGSYFTFRDKKLKRMR